MKSWPLLYKGESAEAFLTCHSELILSRHLSLFSQRWHATDLDHQRTSLSLGLVQFFYLNYSHWGNGSCLSLHNISSRQLNIYNNFTCFNTDQLNLCYFVHTRFRVVRNNITSVFLPPYQQFGFNSLFDALMGPGNPCSIPWLLLHRLWFQMCKMVKSYPLKTSQQ